MVTQRCISWNREVPYERILSFEYDHVGWRFLRNAACQREFSKGATDSAMLWRFLEGKGKR